MTRLDARLTRLEAALGIEPVGLSERHQTAFVEALSDAMDAWGVPNDERDAMGRRVRDGMTTDDDRAKFAVFPCNGLLVGIDIAAWCRLLADLDDEC